MKTSLARVAYRQRVWPDAVAFAAILAVWLLFHWRLFAPSAADRVQLAAGDLTQQFLVFRSFAFDELRQGRLPLWIPCIDGGYPYQADPQSALFYPPGLLNLAVHLAGGAHEFPLVALEWETTLHVLLAALLMYAFVRGEVRSRTAALLGALTFGFGGYLTGYPILQMAIVEAAAWLPLALWGARRLAQHADLRSLVFTAVPLALSILAGHPQTVTFIIYVVSVYFVYRARRAQRPWRDTAARWLGVVGLAAAISAVQLLPSFEYARLSTRADLTFAESGTGFPLSDVIQFVVTGVASHFHPLYVGILPLALAALTISTRRHRDAIFWLLVTLVGLALSFGGNLAVFDPVYWLAPGYRLFRDQERHALIVSLGLSVLSAYGADVLLHSMSRRVRAGLRAEVRWLRLGWVLLAAAFAVVLYLSWQGLDASGIAALPDRVALALLALAASLGVLALRFGGRAGRRWLPIGLVAIVSFDLATANREVNWVALYDPFPTPPPVEAIRADAAPGSIFRIHNEQRLPGHSLCMSGLDEIGGVTPIRLGSFGRFAQSVPREVRWQLLNVRYVVTYRSVLDDHLGRPVAASRLYQQGEGKDAIYVYRLEGEHPRAWAVHQVEIRADRDAIFAALAGPGFDARRVAYTTAPVPVEASTAPLGPVSDPAPEHIAVSASAATYLRLDADLSAPGLLVVSEVNYPGWNASVNGASAPVVEVNGLLRGVALSAGASRVEFAYRPVSLAIGGALTAAGALVGVGLVVFGKRKS